jgi:hypothetical protein
MNGRPFRLVVTGLLLFGTAISLESARGADVTDPGNIVAGVVVDADGVFSVKKIRDLGWRLTRQRILEARSSLPADIMRKSELRKICLNRLEAVVKQKLDAGEPLTDEMLYLAGLRRVKYVFFYPETGDVVIAGPAEGWMTDPMGRVRGIESGGPIVELQDLVVALRAFPPDGQDTRVISCSIDPTQEGLAAMGSFIRSAGTQFAASRSGVLTQRLVRGLRDSLGLQNITIKGVPADTHFAQVLVEADYRMKLIGIGLERPRIQLTSYIDLAKPASPNALMRWYFVPDYECVRVSDDKLAMELVGDGVKLVGADELVTRDGSRVGSGMVDAASKRFVEGFTAKYPELAAKEPVYAQLRNLIDLAVAAAFIQQEDYCTRAGWTMEVFGDERSFPVQTLSTPQRVQCAINAVWKGRTLMTPIGGGVEIRAKKALAAENLLADEQGQVASQRDELTLDHLADGQWWWD